MKRIILAIMILGCVFLSNNCFAEVVSQAVGQSNLPQQDEKTIFSFKKEVGLTDAQENKIKALLFDSQSLLNSYRGSLNTLGTELAQMINKQESMKLIKSKLTEISKIQVEMTCYDIETGRKINAELTPDQLKKWEEIKKAYTKK